MRTLKLITRFYSGIFLANFLVTLSCVYSMSHLGDDVREMIYLLFWYKIISLALVSYIAVYYRKNEQYYYQNLGVSKLQLGLSTSVFDFILWLILVLIQLFIGIPAYIFNLMLWGVLLTFLYIYNK
jgi:hypothetical protein